MNGDTAAFVQFPHPGREKVKPSRGHYPWTGRSAHGRKYLLVLGAYLDGESSEPQRGELSVWGEWEGSSEVVEVWPPDGRSPQNLHVPVVSDPPQGFRQNTDPWVFGDGFRYSNCKQLDPSKRPSRMQSLPRGSVILFGSGLDGAFVLDTVLVVEDSLTATLAEHLDREMDEVFRTHVLESLRTDDAHGAGWLLDRTFTLYRGATPAHPVDGMFSFTPSLAGSGRFPRPSIAVRDGDRDLINARNWQAQAGARPADWLPRQRVVTAWRDVVEQTLAAGLVLAVQVETPAAAGAGIEGEPHHG